MNCRFWSFFLHMGKSYGDASVAEGLYIEGEGRWMEGRNVFARTLLYPHLDHCNSRSQPPRLAALDDLASRYENCGGRHVFSSFSSYADTRTLGPSFVLISACSRTYHRLALSDRSDTRTYDVQSTDPRTAEHSNSHVFSENRCANCTA